MDAVLSAYRGRLGNASLKLSAASPTARLEAAKVRIRRAREVLDGAVLGILQRGRLRLSSATGRLEAVNPLAVLSRGYGMVSDGEGGVVKSVKSLNAGDRISVRVSDGRIDAVVDSVSCEK